MKHHIQEKKKTSEYQSLVLDNRKYTNAKVTTYHDSNQERWAGFSDEIVRQLATVVKTPHSDKSLLSLLQLLGKKRTEIAKELEHGLKEGGRGVNVAYGRMRGIERNTIQGYTPVESLYNPIYQMYPKKWDKLYPVVSQALKPHLQNILLFKDDYDEYSDRAHLYPPEYSPQGFRIEYLFKGDIFISYPALKDEKTAKQSIQEIDVFLQKILAWDENKINEENIELFLADLGVLSWHLYRLMPFYQGTSSIVNWLVRGLAEAKGVTLGMQQNNSEDLPLDFQAFVTFNDQDYGKWFAKNAFEALGFKGIFGVISASDSGKSFRFESQFGEEADIDNEIVEEDEIANEVLEEVAIDNQVVEEEINNEIVNEETSSAVTEKSPLEVSENSAAKLLSAYATADWSIFEANTRHTGLHKISEIAKSDLPDDQKWAQIQAVAQERIGTLMTYKSNIKFPGGGRHFAVHEFYKKIAQASNLAEAPAYHLINGNEKGSTLDNLWNQCFSDTKAAIIADLTKLSGMKNHGGWNAIIDIANQSASSQISFKQIMDIATEHDSLFSSVIRRVSRTGFFAPKEAVKEEALLLYRALSQYSDNILCFPNQIKDLNSLLIAQQKREAVIELKALKTSSDSPDKTGALDALITDLNAADNELSVAKTIEQLHASILSHHDWNSQSAATLKKLGIELQFPFREESLESRMMK